MKLFVSYRSLDSAQVDRLVKQLRGLKKPDNTPLFDDVWQDKTHIHAGEDWWKAIVNGIRDCDLFIFMLSQESAQNVNCRAELSFARKLNRPVIPFVLEDEYIYNTTTGKNDITYWSDIPRELNDSRSQFLFYEGVSFVRELEKALQKLKLKDWVKLPADDPADPRDPNHATNNTIVIYNQAVDFAFKKEFLSAETLFLRLINFKDPLFADDAQEWIVILREYKRLIDMAKHRNLRYKLEKLWQPYTERFPTDFAQNVFDPENVNQLLTAKPASTGQAPTVSAPPPQQVVSVQIPSNPTSKSLMPSPFDWIEIPKKGYSIAKYPVTNAQFAKFIEAGGYNTERWWTKEGWQKRAEGWHYDGSWKASGTPWTEPRNWNDSKWNGDTQPIVGVSWFEAVAFCLWLSEATGEKIMLPTEDQWQYAAQGDDGRTYPWGNDWNRDLCNNNVNKNGIGKTSPVTQYEGKGDSPFGVVDIAGNVWEWCLTDYEAKTNDVNSSANSRVLRGGSWSNLDTGYFRCDVRSDWYPRLGDYYFGFRLSRS